MYISRFLVHKKYIKINETTDKRNLIYLLIAMN